MIEFGWGAVSETGPVRKINQDRLLVADPMFVVADGMGGHQAGEIAAQIAIESLAAEDAPQSVGELVELIEAANSEVVDQSKSQPELRGMGTTLCALVGVHIDGAPALAVANVGDSRLYIRTDDDLVQITEDHSLVETLVRDGRLTPKEAAVHPQRNVLTRALGIDRNALVDSWTLSPVIGDRYLICSDGLFNELSAGEILEILTATDDPETAARQLADDACDAGGHDNVTVIVVDIVGLDPPSAPEGDRVTDFAPAIARIERPATTEASSSAVVSRPVLTWRSGLFAAAILTVIAVLMASIAFYARSGFFVGVDGADVVIFKGRPDGVLWFDPTFEESVEVSVTDLAPSDVDDVIDGVHFDSLDEAKRYGFEVFVRAENQQP